MSMTKTERGIAAVAGVAAIITTIVGILQWLSGRSITMIVQDPAGSPLVAEFRDRDGHAYVSLRGQVEIPRSLRGETLIAFDYQTSQQVGAVLVSPPSHAPFIVQLPTVLAVPATRSPALIQNANLKDAQSGIARKKAPGS